MSSSAMDRGDVLNPNSVAREQSLVPPLGRPCHNLNAANSPSGTSDRPSMRIGAASARKMTVGMRE